MLEQIHHPKAGDNESIYSDGAEDKNRRKATVERGDRFQSPDIHSTGLTAGAA